MVAGRFLIIFFFVFLFSFMHIPSRAQSVIENFPITEYKADGNKATQIIYLSGDGGMNEFSKSLCKELQNKGYSVVAIDSKKYFWNAKTPETFLKDLQKVIKYYQHLWHENSFALLGYSFGADVGAFVPARLSEELIHSMKTAVFLDPSPSTDFEIRLADMLGNNSVERKFSTLKELNTVDYQPVLCLFSSEDENPVKDKIKNNKVEIQVLPGDHRFNYDYKLILSKILKFL